LFIGTILITGCLGEATAEPWHPRSAAYARRMFELEVQSLRRIRLRFGSWHFRTWRSYLMRLPKEYRSPETIYEVVLLAEDDNVIAQMGAFFDLRTAEKCLARFDTEARERMAINYVSVHSRLQDWEFDK
jgi:hypothetical protein